MSLFNLWNFYQLSPKEIELDVTRANMPRLNTGSEEWVANALSAFDVHAQISSWSLKPFRSFYYTDYIDAEVWEDRWPEGWLLQVIFVDAINIDTNKFYNLPAHSGESDPTWAYGFRSPEHDQNALIVSDLAKTFSASEEVMQKLINQTTNRFGHEIECQSQIRTFGGRSHQLRLFVGGIRFPEALSDLEDTLEFCRGEGGAVNWRLSKL
jgi:hypothetical protein